MMFKNVWEPCQQLTLVGGGNFFLVPSHQRTHACDHCAVGGSTRLFCW